MKITYKKLRLQNFRKHKDLTIEFGDCMTTISGANETGKSTIGEAIYFTLFNKASDGSRVEKIRPHDENGIDIDNIDIVVELDIEVDGKPINIIKTQIQNWSTPRGTIEKRFDGNSNKFLIDSVPMSETGFKKYLAEMLSIDEKKFQMLTNAKAFLKENTAGRRKILYSMIPELSDEDVINANPKFEPLRDALRTKTIDGLISACEFALNGQGKTNKGLNGELEDIPKLINSLNSAKVIVDYAELELQKNALKEQISELNKQLSDASEATKSIDALANEIMQTQFEISDIKRKISDKKKEIQSKAHEIEDKISDAEREMYVVSKKIEDLSLMISDNKAIIESCKNELLRENLKIFDNEDWVFDESVYILKNEDKICPTCGRELESESIKQRQEALDKRKVDALESFKREKDAARSRFEAEKDKTLEAIKNKGNRAYLSNISQEKELSATKSKLEEIEVNISSLRLKKNDLEQQIAMAACENTPTEIDSKDILLLESKLERLNAEYDSKKQSGDVRKEIENKRESLQQELANVQKQIDLADNTKIEEEIARLKERQEELGKVLIPQKQKEQLFYEEFQLCKMQLLTDELNKHFQKVKFVLFEKNQSRDGYKDICEPTYNGSYYSDGASDGNTIEIEIDIIRTFQKLQGIQIPIIIDRAESIDSNRIPKSDSQLIIMRRTDDKKLNVEAV